ncbi:MAG: hypothetical protein ABI882_15155 [Acidobacteriota bacterium]
MKKRYLAVALVIGSAIALTACPSETTIGRLNGEPSRYRNKEVSVRGVVTNSFGALGMGAYELDDETGRIWVLTETGVPTKGSRVRAVGQYINGMTWAGKNYGSAVRERNRDR